ncbi:hypothetical protein C8R44DRAFT_746191 [Mycena epipterygia]|nr:hypothetical protein C8R44DRAFT_746191 [Mycena epipterygia]
MNRAQMRTGVIRMGAIEAEKKNGSSQMAEFYGAGKGERLSALRRAVLRRMATTRAKKFPVTVRRSRKSRRSEPKMRKGNKKHNLSEPESNGRSLVKQSKYHKVVGSDLFVAPATSLPTNITTNLVLGSRITIVDVASGRDSSNPRAAGVVGRAGERQDRRARFDVLQVYKVVSFAIANRFVGRTVHSPFWFGFGKTKVLLAHVVPVNEPTQCSTELVFGEMQLGTLALKEFLPLKEWHESSQGTTSAVPAQLKLLNAVTEASAGAAAAAARIRARSFMFCGAGEWKKFGKRSEQSSGRLALDLAVMVSGIMGRGFTWHAP